MAENNRTPNEHLEVDKCELTDEQLNEVAAARVEGSDVKVGPVTITFDPAGAK